MAQGDIIADYPKLTYDEHPGLLELCLSAPAKCRLSPGCVKLLLDENLARWIVPPMQSLYPAIHRLDGNARRIMIHPGF